MENSKAIVEIIRGSVSNRNQVGTIEEYNTIVRSNAWNGEMYKSYYAFDETLKDYVEQHKSVKGFDGLTYIDKIILDIDKGSIPDDQFQPYLLECLKEIDELGIDKSHVNIWFSGTGYHI